MICLLLFGIALGSLWNTDTVFVPHYRYEDHVVDPKTSLIPPGYFNPKTTVVPYNKLRERLLSEIKGYVTVDYFTEKGSPWYIWRNIFPRHDTMEPRSFPQQPQGNHDKSSPLTDCFIRYYDEANDKSLLESDSEDVTDKFLLESDDRFILESESEDVTENESLLKSETTRHVHRHSQADFCWPVKRKFMSTLMDKRDVYGLKCMTGERHSNIGDANWRVIDATEISAEQTKYLRDQGYNIASAGTVGYDGYIRFHRSSMPGSRHQGNRRPYTTFKACILLKPKKIE